MRKWRSYYSSSLPGLQIVSAQGPTFNGQSHNGTEMSLTVLRFLFSEERVNLIPTLSGMTEPILDMDQILGALEVLAVITTSSQ